MRLLIVGLVASSSFLPCGCARKEDGPAGRSKAAIESVYTDLGMEACRKEIDKSDPNETPYALCPGLAGYALIVRHVDAGRQSIEVVDPAQRVFRLDYQEVVTRHMCTLGDKAEWRVATTDGRQVPLALIVRVEAREDDDDPEQVTSSYLAVAKITPDGACVTDRLVDGAQAETDVRKVADSAQGRPCAPPQPPMLVDGNVVR